MANEFKVKNGLIVIGELTTSGTITINGALAATQSWVTSQAYLTSSSLTSYATQSYVTSAIASLVDSAPGALDTLRELATALGNDASFSTTVTNSIASKQNASTAINTSNIASQSVSYATSAGSAGSAGYVTNQSGQLASYDNRTISPSETNASYLQFGFTSFNNNNTAPWADYLHLRSYEDSSAGADNLVVFNKSTIGMRIYQQTFGSASAYSSYADVWHSGNLTNLNQLTNGPGYLTSYTEVDTLATVTGRGATTNTSITVGHDLTVQADGGVGHTASRLWLNSHNNYRGAGVHMSGVGSTWFAGTPYTDFDGGYVIARTGTSNDQASAQYSNALLTVKSSGNVGIGTDTPASKLSITGTVTVTQGDYNQDSFLNASAIFYYAIKKARGTSSVPLALNTNDKIGGISASGYTGSGYITASAIEFRNSGAVSASSMPTSILFTAGSTNFSGRTPSLKISETENILINATASDTAKLSIKGSGSTSATTSLLVQNSASDTSMAVLDNGNVGIGTASPGTNKLHVFNGSSGGVAYNSGGLVVESSGRASIQLLAPNNQDSYLFFGDANSGTGGYIGHYGTTMSPADLMVYYSEGNHNFTNGNVGIGTSSPSTKLDVNGVITATGGNSTNWNTAYSWGNHASAGYLTSVSDIWVNTAGDTMTGSLSFSQASVIKKRFTTGTNNPVKTASGVLTSRSDNSGGSTYYIIETNVPQDDYQMGGFTIEIFGNYSGTNHKTKIDLGGYWNPESNGGFEGFEAHGSNPQYKPTIEVARNTSGKTVFIIYGGSWNYPVIVARDLWLGYSGSDGGTYGEGWSIIGTSDISSYVNRDTVVWRNAYSDSNPAGYLTSYSETDTLASVTGRGGTTATPITISTGSSQPLSLTTANGSPWHLALNRTDLGLTSRVFAHDSPYNGWYFEHNISIAGNTNWHSGNLTNLNQLSNGPGYITGYTETDTLASVTGRGATTSTNISVNNVKIGTDGTYGGGYSTIGFGGTTNGYNRVFGQVGTSDGLFLASATGRGIYFRVNGGSTDNVTINSSGNVAINTANFTYANGDNASVISGVVPTANKLFIDGSIQLLNNTDAIVIGRGASTFLTDEELGFGWGSGWYMIDASYLRVRNNIPVYSTGSFYGSVFYDVNDTSYYVDPNSTSNLNNLSVVGYQYIGGQTSNGQSNYQWSGATYQTPSDWTARLILRRDNASTGVNGSIPSLVIFNNNGADQTTASMVFATNECVTGSNSVNLAGIVAKKESVGNCGGWSSGSLNFFVKNYATRIDSLALTPDGNATFSGLVYSTGYGNSSQWNTAYGWGNHASADYIVRGTQIASSAAWTTATRFGSVGDISQDAGNHALSVRSENGNDAFMSFHIGGDYAVHFGLDDATNRLHTGGWSDGAVKYQLWDSRDFTSTNVSNWNTAYSWGNHASQSYATTSYVTTQINNLINGAPGALDTLDELAAALGDDASFATTVTNSIATKLPLAGGTMSGTISFINNLGTALQGTIGDNDFWRIHANSTSSNAGYLEIATSDDGTEPIYVRQYTGVFSSLTRTATLLDGSGNTSFPGNLTVGGTITESSSIKLKENVKTSGGNLEKVVNLRPVTYNKIGSQTTELGLIAEEVATVYPEFVQYDESGEPVGVNYSRLTAALIGAVKELTQRIETLENNG